MSVLSVYVKIKWLFFVNKYLLADSVGRGQTSCFYFIPFVVVVLIEQFPTKWTFSPFTFSQRDLEFTLELDFKGQLCEAAISHDYKMR